jgi:predicted DCC family thiol-disulfide oxidoreductase YuxK
MTFTSGTGPAALVASTATPLSAKGRLALHANASAESVAMVRIGVFLLCAAEALMLARQAMPVAEGTIARFGFLALVPDSGLDLIRSATGQLVLYFAAGIAAVAAALGIAPRVSMPLATGLFIVTQAIPRALQGHVNHAQIPVMFASLLLTLGPSADALCLWPRRAHAATRPTQAYQATLVIILGIVCLGYTFIAAYRLAYGGWALFTSDTLLHWFAQRNLGAPDPNATLGMVIVRSPLLSQLSIWSFPAITMLELLAPLTLISRRFRLFFIPSMLLVHVGIYFAMHISFSQLACLYVLFIDSAYWSPRKPAVDAHGTPQPLLILFDGVCGLCNRFVDFLVARDHTSALRFASLQGTTAASIPNLPNVDSVIVADGDTLRIRSEGAITALSRLGGLWSFVAVFGLVPRPIRDTVYAFIARNRYRWFGRYDACRLPTAAEQHWFLP